LGLLAEPLAPGRSGRWDEAASLVIRMEAGELASAPAAAVLGGANTLAVASADGEWELVGFRSALLVAPATWRLTGLLRGLAGTERAARAGAVAGATAVRLDGALARAETTQAERGLPLTWRAAPAGAPPGGLAAAGLTASWRGVARRPWSPA